MSKSEPEIRKSRKSANLAWAAGILVSLGIGFAAGHAAVAHTSGDDASFLREPTSYPLISPLLGVSVGDKSDFAELQPLEKKFSAEVASDTQNGSAADVSVYFQNINNGHWTGVNENDGYDPASLLKVPIMMAAYRQAESDASLLSQTITYQPPPADLQADGFETLALGKAYSVGDLVNAMITQSDNGAKDALGMYLNPTILQQTFTYFQLPPLSASSSYAISAKEYSRFFRTLYNATYLDQEKSSQSLSLLTKTTFIEGLAAGMPTSTVIAHKFGQYINPADPNDTELHDCGIIYYPSNPYILCVMTKGSNLSTLESIIASMSSIAYAWMK